MPCRTTIRHFVLLSAYCAYLATPVVHRAMEATQWCDECHAAQIHGAVIGAHCDGPCHDPTHHHHRAPHDPIHCIVCQSHAESYSVDATYVLDFGAVTLAAAIPPPSIVPRSADRHGPDAPRGPPADTLTA